MFAPKTNYSISNVDTTALIEELQNRLQNILTTDEKAALGKLSFDIGVYLGV